MHRDSTGAAFLLAATVLAAATGARGQGAKPDWLDAPAAPHSAVLQLVGPTRSAELAIDGKTIAALVESSAVLDPAIERSLNLSAADVRRAVAVAAEVANDRVVTLRVAVGSGVAVPLPPDAGRKLLDELVGQTRRAVEQSAHAAAQPRRQQHERTRANLATARDRLTAAQQAHEAAVRSNPHWRAGPPPGRTELERQRQNAERAIAGLRARLQVLEQATADGDQTETIALPPIPEPKAAAELLRLRTARAAAARQLPEGSGADGAVAAADEAKLEAEALLHLANALRTGLSARTSRGDDLPQLRATLADQEAQFAVIEKQLAAMPTVEGLPDASDVQRLETARMVAEQEVSRLTAEEQRLAALDDDGSVRLILLDGNADAQENQP